MNPHCESSLLWRMPYTCTNSMDYSSFHYYSNIKRDSEAYRLGRGEAYKSWRISGLPPFYSSTVLQGRTQEEDQIGCAAANPQFSVCSTFASYNNKVARTDPPLQILVWMEFFWMAKEWIFLSNVTMFQLPIYIVTIAHLLQPNNRLNARPKCKTYQKFWLLNCIDLTAWYIIHID